MQRAIFVDVDGTLTSHTGEIPESARVAVQEARANGHLVFLATGRSPASLWDELRDIGFDGAITGAGAHVEVGGVVLADSAMTPDQVTHVSQFFDEHGVAYILESVDGLMSSTAMADRIRRVLVEALGPEGPPEEPGSRRFLRGIHLDVDPLSMPVHKVGIFDSPIDLDAIRAGVGEDYLVIPATVTALGENAGELSPRGVHKAKGIEAVCAHLDIDPADTVAFGDGMNDLEMLAYAGVGVAMGGAPQAVIDAADTLTAAPHEHGLAEAFARLGLVGDLAA